MFLFVPRDQDRNRQDEEDAPTEAQLQGTKSVLHQLQELCADTIQANRSNKAIARSWLITAITSLPVTNPAEKRRRLAQFLPGGSSYIHTTSQTTIKQGEFGRRLLCLVFQTEAERIGRILAQQPNTLRAFFAPGYPHHIQAWFGHFSMSGISEFKHGALALSQFALAHRDKMWNDLVWRGKHSQAPVAVSQKLHYFCEIDVVSSICALRDCREFWESKELADSVEDGALLSIDPMWFAEKMYGWLQEESKRSTAVFDIICDVLESTAWRELCRQTVDNLSNEDVLKVADGIMTEEQQNHEDRGIFLVFGNVHWSYDELLLAIACSSGAAQFLRMLKEDVQNWKKFEALIKELSGLETRVVCLRLLHTCDTPTARHQLLLLHLLILRYWLNHHEGLELAEHLSASGFTCRVAHADNKKRSKKHKKDKKKKKKKKRRRHEHDDDFADIPDYTGRDSSGDEDNDNKLGIRYEIDIPEKKVVGVFELQDVVLNFVSNTYIRAACKDV